MHENITSYDIQIERIINEFQSFLLDDASYTGIYINLKSPEHSQYFLNFVNNLNSQTIYSRITYQWYLFSPKSTPTIYIPYFTLKIELEKK